MRVQALAANPLYDPRFEHDACGLGLIARADGMRSRELVERALAMLAAMEHRGARGADPDTGDGAGLMLQVPDRLLRRFCRAELELELPPPGHYAVAMCFLPTDPALRLRCEELCVRIAVEEGQQPLGWRDVPRDSSAIGRLARESEPVVRQLLVAQGPTGDERAFRRKLTVIRRRVELAAAARRVPEATFHIASFSSSTLTYKGLLTARQLPAYYADLREPEIETAMALVHSRFSTNTLGSWDLAHPFHYLAHNGEINTVRGNRQWMHAREPQLRSAQLGDDLPKLFPLIDERWSDSAALDAAFELLVLAGRAPAHALAMLIPAAWSQATPMADDLRAFYEFHAGMLEPWDGPAAIAFCDGRQAGATLDRNGLRPVPLPGHARRPARARVRGRRARARPGRGGRQRPPQAGPDADRRHRRRAHPRRRRDQARARAPPPLSRAARRAEDLPRGHPVAARRAARAATRSNATCGSSATPTRSCATSSRRWPATARSRSPRWASTRRWPRSRSGRGCCAASSSSSSRRSRTPPSTRSARRS